MTVTAAICWEEYMYVVLYLSVAKSLLAAGKMDFGSTVLTVVEPPSEYNEDYDDDDDDDDDDAGPEAAGNAVRVTSIPRSMSQQMLRSFLESEKIGAGPIYDIRFTDDDDSAIVYFQHANGRLGFHCHNQRPIETSI